MKKEIAVNPDVERRLSEKGQIFENTVKVIEEKQKRRNHSMFLDSGEENEWKDTRRQRNKK